MNFQTKLVIIFTFSFGLVAGFMLIFTQQSKKLINKDIRENRENFAKIIQVSAQRLAAIPESQPEKIQQLIDELKTNEAVNEVTIVDRNWKVIESTNKDIVGQFHPLSSMDAVINEKPDTESVSNEYIPFEISVPIIRDRRITGMVRTTVILKDIQRPLQSLYYKNLSISLLLLCLGLASSLFILHRTNKPLRRMAFAAKQIAEGYLSVKLSGSKHDDIGRLEETFNLMSTKLAEQKKLEKQLSLLEKHATLSEIASYLAHEIRNPLNLIMLTVHHLERQFVTQDKDIKSKFLEMTASLKSEVEQLDKVVAAFLDIGKPITLNKSNFKVMEIFDQIQSLVRQQLIEKNISLIFSGDTTAFIFADPERIRLVFLNIIVNAISAVFPGGRIIVEFTNQLHFHRITISDDGPGIPADVIDHVFEPYFTRRPGGTGLGLALAKRIIEDHEGSTSASNLTSRGACFEILIPLEKKV